MDDNNDNERTETLMKQMLEGESSIKRITVSVASALLVASIMGSVVLYKEFIHIQDWADHHEVTAGMHIARIGDLEFKAAQGGRWTLEDHKEYAKAQASQCGDCFQRISLLERSKDITDFKLEIMDDKLDEIIEALVQVGKERNGAM